MERIASRTVKVRDGEIIIQEDTWPYYAYILKEGKAKVLKNVDGKQVLIGLLTEGDIFGEITFLIYSRLVVLFQNMQNRETKIIDAKTFEMGIEKMPEFMRDVAIAIARRYNVAVERLTKLSSQVEEKQLRLLTQYLNLTQN